MICGDKPQKILKHQEKYSLHRFIFTLVPKLYQCDMIIMNLFIIIIIGRERKRRFLFGQQ